MVKQSQNAAQHRQPVNALRQSDTFFRSLSNCCPVGIFATDTDGHCTYINPRCQSIYGFCDEESLGESWTQFVHVDDRELVSTEWLAHTQNGSQFSRQCRFQTPQGTSLWVYVRSAPLLDDEGNLIGYVSTVEDITQYKQAEDNSRQLTAQIQEQANVLNAILSASVDNIYVFDRIGRYQYVSQGGANVMGYEPEQLLGKTWRDTNLPIDIMARVDAEREVVIATGQPIRAETEYLGVDGMHYYEYILTPWRSPEGVLSKSVGDREDKGDKENKGDKGNSCCQPTTYDHSCPHESIKGVITISRDITERKRAEETLQASEQRYRALLDALPHIIWETDAQGLSEYGNSRWFEYTGLSPAQSPAQGWIEVLHPDDAPDYINCWRHALQTEQPFDAFGRIRRHDGAYRWFHSIGMPVRNAQGEIIMWVGSSFDIDEERRAKEVLRDALQKLNFHVENTPLAVVEWDRELRIQRWSASAERIFGWQAEDVLGKSINDFPLVYQEDMEAVSVVSRRLAEAEPQNVSYNRNYTKDGSVIHCEWYNSTLIDESGKMTSVLSLVLDVSDVFGELRLRKQAEKALRLSQERYRSLVDSLPQLVCMASADGITEYCNQSWMNYTGLTLEQTQGFGWQQAFHPEDLPLVMEQWTQALETGSAYSIEFRLRRFDGVYRWHLSRIVPIKAEEDRIAGWLATATDIDDQKHIEQQERFLAQASQTFAAASLDLQTVLDTITRLASEFTDDVCVLSLLSEDGQWLDPVSCYHFDPEVREFISELLSSYPRRADEGIGGRVMQTGEPLLMPVTSQEEFRAAIKPEYQLYLERFRVYSTLLVPLKVRGQAIGVLSLTRNYPGAPHNSDDQSLFQDLADRAAMAIANARLYQQAQQARQQAVQTADRTARLQAVTAALSESLTPAQVAEVIVEQSIAVLNASSAIVAIVSENATELEIVHSVGYQQDFPEEWRRFPITTPVPLAEAVRTGEPIWEESTQERIARYPHLAQNYAELNYAAWISLPLMVEGRAVGGISINFTQFLPLSKDERAFMLALAQQSAQAIARARLYEAEQRARASAVSEAARSATANRIKDEFLAVLSHELRSPLNPILGWTKLLRTRKFDEKATDRALETIERNALLQTQLIEDLLDVSRILRGKMVLNVSPVNLATTVEAALETVQLAAQSKGIQIQTIFAPNVEFVSGDSARLQQVIWNLLSNAVKFTPSGGRVEVRIEQNASYAQLVVSDTGKGINPEFVPYVFDYFRQEDGKITRKFGGLGLGLAIVRHLVELHGGTVEADSPGEGQGATFTVKLPSTGIVKEPDFDSESPVTTFNLSQLRILVVDDEADMRELVVAILSEYGAQVRVAASAAEALTALDQFKPDVLISDIGMPEVDGYMLMRQVRQLPPQQGGLIRAIALTAYAGEYNQQQALEAGFQRHLAKPVEPYELVKTIATLLGRSR